MPFKEEVVEEVEEKEEEVNEVPALETDLNLNDLNKQAIEAYKAQKKELKGK